ncbi:vacuolar protein sorting-associated protein 37B-like isoform X1 [Varroa destructor]|uniref:VPS37 C-terminal domain-containing protein n=2 Tax=Varroa destructor TaxID=109461 RepID=A0A7M7KJ57_VARDE|nr:vacuolar protein sorting-associated protein 37B-like isoform X1 [Varroa destructor]
MIFFLMIARRVEKTCGSLFRIPPTVQFVQTNEINDELKCMIECEDATLDLQFSDGPAARGMERSRNQLLEENRRIARENVDKESQFFELRNRLLQLYHEGKQLKSVVEQLQENIPASNCHPPTLDTIQALLEAAAREAEDESEKIASDFLSSTINTEDFLEKFIGSRKDLHLRRVRAEKAAELMREQNRVPTTNVLPFSRFTSAGVEYQPPSLPNMGPVIGPPIGPVYGSPMPSYGTSQYLPYPTPQSTGGPISMPTPGL